MESSTVQCGDLGKDIFIENGANVVGTRHAVSVNDKVNTDNWCAVSVNNRSIDDKTFV